MGTLRRYVKGQVLDPSRSRGMTLYKGHASAHLRLIWGEGTGPPAPLDPSTWLRASGIPRPLDSGSGGMMGGLAAEGAASEGEEGQGHADSANTEDGG